MTHLATSIGALLPLTWLVVGASPAAQPAIGWATLIYLGAAQASGAVIANAGQVVFRNTAEATTRIVFARKDADAIDCDVDDEAVVRSRHGQYLLARGAELRCIVEPGHYRYTTVTTQGDQVHETRATLRVKK